MKGGYIFSPYHVENVPPISLAPLRSPPSGRLHSYKRNRSGSDSPPAVNKKDRVNSPSNGMSVTSEKEDEISTTANSHSQMEGREASPVVFASSIKDMANCDPLQLSNIQASSPRTGTVSFDFSKKNVLSRRLSLNY